MVPANRKPTHPAEVLFEEFLIPLGIQQATFARHIGVSASYVNDIVRKRHGISATTAWLFAQALGTSPEFWMNLQDTYDLAKRRPRRHIARLQPVDKS